MERGDILPAIKQLPSIESTGVQSYTDVRTEIDGGAKIRITRRTLFTALEEQAIMVVVKGDQSERRRVIAKFVDALGWPVDGVPSVDKSSGSDTLIWLFEKGELDDDQSD